MPTPVPVVPKPNQVKNLFPDDLVQLNWVEDLAGRLQSAGSAVVQRRANSFKQPGLARSLKSLGLKQGLELPPQISTVNLKQAIAGLNRTLIDHATAVSAAMHYPVICLDEANTLRSWEEDPAQWKRDLQLLLGFFTG